MEAPAVRKISIKDKGLKTSVLEDNKKVQVLREIRLMSRRHWLVKVQRSETISDLTNSTHASVINIKEITVKIISES